MRRNLRDNSSALPLTDSICCGDEANRTVLTLVVFRLIFMGDFLCGWM